MIYFGTKFVAGLTPLEKKAALIAAAFLLWRLLVIFSINFVVNILIRKKH